MGDLYEKIYIFGIDTEQNKRKEEQKQLLSKGCRS